MDNGRGWVEAEKRAPFSSSIWMVATTCREYSSALFGIEHIANEVLNKVANLLAKRDADFDSEESPKQTRWFIKLLDTSYNDTWLLKCILIGV